MKVCSQIDEGNTPAIERLHPFYEQEKHASEIGCPVRVTQPLGRRTGGEALVPFDYCGLR